MIVLAMQRRADIDRAKGLGILLVVFGHLVARADPAGVGWYEPLRHAVYSFHMPFFFYLSGFVLMISGGVLKPRPGWIQKRAERLLAPFLAMGLIVVIGKYAFSRLIFVDHAPADLGAGMSGLIWHTNDSADGSIWYLAVLFFYSLAVPVIMSGRTARLWLILILAVMLFFITLPAYVYADQFAHYAIFFTAGLLAGAFERQWDEFMQRTWNVWLLALLLICAVVALRGAGASNFFLLPAGLSSIPALHGLVRFSRLNSSQALLWLGRYCFMIYLFNTIFIGLTKGLLLQLTDWDGPHFIPFACCLMFAGVFGPVTLKTTLIRRWKRLDQMTD